MLTLFGTLVIGGVLLFMGETQNDKELQGRILRRLSIVVAGAWVLVSMFYFPWVVLDIFRVFSPDDQMTQDIFGLVMEGFGWVRQNWQDVTSFLASREIPGFYLIALIPSANLEVRGMLVLVLVAAAIGTGWAFISLALAMSQLFLARRVRMFGSIAVGALSLITAIVLLWQLPTLDAWGTHGTFLPAMASALSGAHLGWGALAGLAGLMVVSLGCFLDADEARKPPY